MTSTTLSSGSEAADAGDDAAFVALSGGEAADATADDADADDTDADEADADGESWKAKYEAQVKVNKDLDRKVKREYNKVLSKARSEVKAELDALKAEVAKSHRKGEGEESDADAIREQARAEARAEVLRDRVLDKIEAKARKFVDPGDAAAILLRDNEVDEFIDDDKIDVDAIVEALDDLLTKKPHLAAQGGTKAPKPDRSQGARGKGAATTAQQFADAIPL